MLMSFATLERRRNDITVIISKEIFPDKATERKILPLAIKCPNGGCEWTGELRIKKVKPTQISINVNNNFISTSYCFRPLK